ncbi:hypothetical protein C8N40_103263 [Pontibacter mucosus]|uniref:Uncharacterized protein n=1 Tax=Pontibacter mucosus TaxID=1649266 RepID=A0A2T5YLJ2_9BACT|nr:hypothetical protein C8N40_103263 [Pontibacter mucosus]
MKWLGIQEAYVLSNLCYYTFEMELAQNLAYFG